MKNGENHRQNSSFIAPVLKKKLGKFFMFMLIFVLIMPEVSFSAQLNPPRAPELSTIIPLPALRLGVGQADSPRDVALTLQILALMTVLSLVPAILLMVTSFTRIIIVLGFVQRAIGLQQSPPQQVIAGLAMFLTMFTMYPTWSQVYGNGIEPYLSGNIDASQAWENSINPVREFMFKYTRQEELSLIISMSKSERPANQSEVPTRVLIPAFMLSELKTAFQMGVVIYIPFLVVDMVVSSVLLAMGMMMLPPMMISLPFKLLLFIMADGWNLVVMSVLKSFANVP